MFKVLVIMLLALPVHAQKQTQHKNNRQEARVSPHRGSPVRSTKTTTAKDLRRRSTSDNVKVGLAAATLVAAPFAVSAVDANLTLDHLKMAKSLAGQGVDMAFASYGAYQTAKITGKTLKITGEVAIGTVMESYNRIRNQTLFRLK